MPTRSFSSLASLLGVPPLLIPTAGNGSSGCGGIQMLLCSGDNCDVAKDEAPIDMLGGVMLLEFMGAEIGPYVGVTSCRGGGY